MADKTPTQAALQREARLRTRLSETQVDRLVTLLQTFLERAFRRKELSLARTDVSVREAARALADLEEVVRAAGLGDILSGVRDLFTQELGLSLEDFSISTGRNIALSGFAEENLSALVDDRLNLAARLVNSHIGDVRTAVLDSVVLGNAPDVLAAAASVGDTVYRHLKTELNTALMAYQRVVHFETADEAGITKFLYVGPDDDVTRPFCQDHVGKIYTRDEIAKLDNGQGLPVEVYCGGYNCRHHWRPVSDALAKELGGGA